MSPENVAIIRGAFESFGAAGMDAVVDLLDPAVELYGAVGGIEQGAVVRGVTGVADALSVDSDIWAECRFELQRLVDAGDRVVALVREQRRGRGSGIDVQADIALIYTLAEGRIVRIEPYMSQSDALEAVGLSE